MVSEALAVLTQQSIPQAHPALLRLYTYDDEAGVKRDAEGDLRTALLGALLPMADTRGQTLMERQKEQAVRKMPSEYAHHCVYIQ